MQVWDLSSQLLDLREAEDCTDQPSSTAQVPARQSRAEQAEGYALDWSCVAAGRLASGSCACDVHVWEPVEGGRWIIEPAFRGHSGSVEDVQWSPSEATVFASCSADKSIRIWDTRERGRPMISVAAHATDVNVISWNVGASFMLASGADDGTLRVWDLRSFTDQSFVANFAYHTGPICSVEWSAAESSVLATCAGDGQLAVWDLALERDPEEEVSLAPDVNAVGPDDLPAQLLFVHAGQTDMKELHWHPQIPGMIISTAADGFNVFQPSNLL